MSTLTQNNVTSREKMHQAFPPLFSAGSKVIRAQKEGGPGTEASSTHVCTCLSLVNSWWTVKVQQGVYMYASLECGCCPMQSSAASTGFPTLKCKEACKETGTVGTQYMWHQQKHLASQ